MHFSNNHPLTRDGVLPQLTAQILASVQSPLILWDLDSDVVAFNDAFCELFGYTPAEAERISWLDLIPPRERAATSAFIRSRDTDSLHQIHWKARALTADGTELKVACSSSTLTIDGATALLTQFQDITDREDSQTVIEGLQARHRRVVERAPVAIFTTGPNNRFRSANPVCIELLGRPLEELRELTPADLVHPDHQAEALHRRQTRSAEREELEALETPILQRNGGVFWCEVLMLPRYDADGTFLGTDGFARDISRERELQHELERQVSSDPLTGAANRRRFDQVLNERVNEARRYNTPFSLLMLDLDHFKRVNDTLGHLAGDAVLRAVAAALSRISRDSDIVARYGGEEFTVILPQTDAPGAADAAERCRAAIEELTVDWESTPIRVTASVGAATFYPAIHESATTLVSDADAAVYAAKHGGRNRVCIANDLSPEVVRRSA